MADLSDFTGDLLGMGGMGGMGMGGFGGASISTEYTSMEKEELLTLKNALQLVYEDYRSLNLDLNMARGKPSSEQLDLSLPLLDVLKSDSDLHAENGTDCRNYGVLDGIGEAKQLMATLMDDEPGNVIVFGTASLNIMYDTVARCWMFGTQGSAPWSTLDTVKWLCPVPGYDRHFGITQAFGIEMINVPMTDKGPDMDVVEKLVAEDASIKGIWCVPKYSNPTGVTYSDETVKRLASMECAADDFRIFWDNAYGVHHLYDDTADQATVLDIRRTCEEAGNANRCYKFASTSKITFPGSGLAALAASAENVAEIKAHMGVQTIGHDKLNQLRHARFLENGAGLAAHMSKHAALIRPKFEKVYEVLDFGLSDTGVAAWSTPKGGYFISFDGLPGTATRIVELAKQAGVTMTGAGATFPYGNDPEDRNIRIAPTLPCVEDLDMAMQVFVCCVKLASLEVLTK